MSSSSSTVSTEEEKRRLRNQKKKEKKKAKKAASDGAPDAKRGVQASTQPSVAKKHSTTQTAPTVASAKANAKGQGKGKGTKRPAPEEKAVAEKPDGEQEPSEESSDEEETEDAGPATGDDVMKALEEAFKHKKQAKPVAKKPKTEKPPKEEKEGGEEDEGGLDDIFAQLKKGKQNNRTDHSKPSTTKSQGDEDDWFNSRGMRQSGRKYVDGLPVYTEAELRIGKGGGTPLCPFDCTCCY